MANVPGGKQVEGSGRGEPREKSRASLVGPHIGHGWKSGLYSRCIGKLLEGMNEVTLLWASISLSIKWTRSLVPQHHPADWRKTAQGPPGELLKAQIHRHHSQGSG